MRGIPLETKLNKDILLEASYHEREFFLRNTFKRELLRRETLPQGTSLKLKFLQKILAVNAKRVHYWKVSLERNLKKHHSIAKRERLPLLIEEYP